MPKRKKKTDSTQPPVKRGRHSRFAEGVVIKQISMTLSEDEKNRLVTAAQYYDISSAQLLRKGAELFYSISQRPREMTIEEVKDFMARELQVIVNDD